MFKKLEVAFKNFFCNLGTEIFLLKITHIFYKNRNHHNDICVENMF
ncbi:unnamed protein product [Tenebrio molitor]|nr:unnamed protein product [Tenebrio molitor]